MLFNLYTLTIYKDFHNRKVLKCPSRSTLILLSFWLSLCLVAGCVEKAALTFPQQAGALSVEMAGFRNDDGEALVSLFSSKEGFPDNMGKAWQNLHVQIKNGRALAVFADLPYGDYGLAVLHDEDMDGQMESSWLGQPLEGFGFSGRPEYNFGPPAFDETVFLLASATRQVVVWMRYETERQNKQNQRRADQNGKP